MIDWKDIPDERTDMGGGHSHYGSWDLTYPSPYTPGQHEGLAALIRYAIDHLPPHVVVEVDWDGPKNRVFWPCSIRCGGEVIEAEVFLAELGAPRPARFEVQFLIGGNCVINLDDLHGRPETPFDPNKAELQWSE